MHGNQHNQPDPPSTAQMQNMGGIACRQRAKDQLLDQVDALRRRAHKLEALAYAAEFIHGDAEEALWEIACGAKL